MTCPNCGLNPSQCACDRKYNTILADNNAEGVTFRTTNPWRE